MLESQPTQTYRLTWDELMSRRGEIAPDAILEVRVYSPPSVPQVDAENQALLSLLRSWREEDAAADPQERDRRDADTEALMASLQVNRLSLHTPEGI